ncbi:hypothetical protein DCAR_0625109 [Daucus carota subsp. sativus]|uniref:Uncharacterized protein n=1 Tax=Daucus carota subsp. sativus TaxID=79200 RepID=A0A164W897_DAUCS|nr:PREDICTED: uncharacterized GPI-anchored protein At4g28100 [Daucus carota subsp. sativus]WOH05689.1 hypothetical protein DCAR_0625109 [Daucus carota subsp. sativus]
MNINVIVSIFILTLLFHQSVAGLLAEPAQPIKLGDYQSPNTVPAFPVQTEAQTCRLDLSAELFGGVNAACGRNLDRSRCCPVLAAWLFAAHARSALQITTAAPVSSDLPMMPDDSQKCVNTLQSSLLDRKIHIPQPNNSCDAVLCFCGIRLHQISSLTCTAAFNISGTSRNATPTAAVKNLEHNCRNSSYAGCTKCLGALQKLKGDGKNGTSRHHPDEDSDGNGDRARKMLNRDCQLMGLTWLLARNKTAYIPTVSAVLRAIMYSAHPHESKCSPDQENMPLAVDSLQLDKSYASSSTSSFQHPIMLRTVVPVLALLILSYLLV